MKKRFKRIYIEILNVCNLSCSFCTKTKRSKRKMTPAEFEEILKKIDSYTDYIYLHVKGEPLLHPELKQILDISEKYKKKVPITTNGTLLKETKEILVNSKAVRQINLSLHSENKKENYLEDIFKVVDDLSKNKYIVYRFWTLQNNIFDQKSTETVNKIASHYHLSTELVEKIKKEYNINIAENIYISKDNQFLWPELENNYYEEKGYCHALKDQLAILVDGTVVPCCLDGEGIIDLGNIYSMDLESILKSDRVLDMKRGFECRNVKEELCKHCNFKEKFNR
ncbi:MAG: radical SAM protein, partial [Bacilli bacterium]|nr:radical SAM protein [Bacilli bacterium]